MVERATLESDRVEALTLLTTLSPADANLRDEATCAVHDLYLRVRRTPYRLTYQKLTGDLLPEIRILDPAEIFPGKPSVLELIKRVDALIESMQEQVGAPAHT